MNEKACGAGNGGFKEAVCIHTDKVYDSCRDKDCLENMFREVKAHNIQNVAVDVRNNGGGSSLVINSFFRYLDIDDFYESSWNTRLGPFTVKHKKPYRKNF